MRDNGELRDDIDAPTMATSVMAAVQGGYLLAQTAHDSTPMKMALDMGNRPRPVLSATPLSSARRILRGGIGR